MATGLACLFADAEFASKPEALAEELPQHRSILTVELPRLVQPLSIGNNLPRLTATNPAGKWLVAADQRATITTRVVGQRVVVDAVIVYHHLARLAREIHVRWHHRIRQAVRADGALVHLLGPVGVARALHTMRAGDDRCRATVLWNDFGGPRCLIQCF